MCMSLCYIQMLQRTKVTVAAISTPRLQKKPVLMEGTEESNLPPLVRYFDLERSTQRDTMRQDYSDALYHVELIFLI